MERTRIRELILREFGEHFEQSPLKVSLYFMASFGVLILFSLPVYWIAIAPTPSDRAWWKYLIALAICIVPAVYLGRFASTALLSLLKQEKNKAWWKHRDLELDSKKARFFESHQSREKRKQNLDVASSSSNMLAVIYSVSVVFSGFYTGLRYLAVKSFPTFSPEQLEIAVDILESLDVDTKTETSKVFEICRQRGVEDDAIHSVLDSLRSEDVVLDSLQGGIVINPEKPYFKYTKEAWAEKHLGETSAESAPEL